MAMPFNLKSPRPLGQGFLFIAPLEGWNCLFAVPGEVKYKILVFGPKAKMKLAKPVLNVVEVYPYGLPRG
ncbi:hypothetical protein U1E44_04625 [Arenibacter sp. GZD96]|uniref:hypothetical protein n=1 Tax=Aurantibrevibacter litoralis TaxID=3106030 RepID=UPI002AFF4AF2|nr:hypothetical protein [Arenibacter sp. GZD-96]MEA1785367.1 hypothetical protein [Arenibacter sp. GZD-96]